MTALPTAKSLIQGEPFGEVFPPRPTPNLPSVGGRFAALDVLRQYIAELTFFRANAEGAAPIPFQVPEDQIFMEWPDNEVTLQYPSISVADPDWGTYDCPGLTGYVAESTRDKFGKGTIIVVQSEWQELLKLRVTTSTRAERRALVAGLEYALVPTEQMYGVRFRLPEYYNETVCFSLNRAKFEDDQEASKGRRRALLEVEMRFNVVALVNIGELETDLTIDVLEEGEDLNPLLPPEPPDPPPP